MLAGYTDYVSDGSGTDGGPAPSTSGYGGSASFI
jgi:hypothetical protein